MSPRRHPVPAAVAIVAAAWILTAGATASAQGTTPLWTLSLARGTGGDTTIAVENRCANPHDFSIDVGQLPWVELRGTARVRVAGRTTVTVPARVETGTRDVGAEDGVLIVRCESCAADPLCTQRVDRVPGRLRVLWPEEELSDDSHREVVAGQVLAVVGPTPDRAARQRLERWREELGVRSLDSHDLSLRRITLLRLDLGTGTLGAALRALQADPGVLWSQPVYRYSIASEASGTSPAPADPYLSRQWGLRHIGADAAATAASGDGVRIAVLDSGVDARHPDLDGRIEASVDLVGGARRVPGEVHGTAVAGVLAATAANGVGIRGLAPGARLLAARVCAETSATTGAARGDTVTLARGLDWAAARRAQVINISLAGPRDPLVRSLLGELSAAGVAVVAAAGNRGGAAPASLPADDPPRYPAAYSGVLAVSSVGIDGAPFPGALHGPWVGLLAPGEEILTTVPGGAFRPMTGSSFAAPHASGALARILEQSPEAAPTEAVSRLRERAAAVAGTQTSGFRIRAVDPSR